MKHSLTDWLPTKLDFELFHVYCHQKDYRLCWALNQAFRFELQRVTDFLEIPEKENETKEEISKRLETITYAQFHFKDEVTHRSIYVLANHPINRSVVTKQGDLFATEKMELLIPELPLVDYFIQLYGQFEPSDIDDIQEKLNLIPMINAAHLVNTETLRSYANLMH
ncbi:MAG: IPExxxVDY family protein [Flavobacteriales bacterium]|nr:IPExxxVDY family protein [Flavobacteriales bacterium]